MASSMTSSTYLSSMVYPQRPTPMYPSAEEHTLPVLVPFRALGDEPPPAGRARARKGRSRSSGSGAGVRVERPAGTRWARARPPMPCDLGRWPGPSGPQPLFIFRGSCYKSARVTAPGTATSSCGTVARPLLSGLRFLVCTMGVVGSASWDC